jgi:hypothetical protein
MVVATAMVELAAVVRGSGVMMAEVVVDVAWSCLNDASLIAS